MSKCSHCGQEIKSAEAAAYAASHPPERKYIKIPSEAAFRSLCSMLLKSPGCKDEKFIGALEDFPKALQRYGQLTEGQWKFFCAIHKSVLGTWPPKAEEIVEAEARKEAALPDEEEIPF